jgi:hypothetical protein
MNVKGKQHWLWTWQNEMITFLAVAKSRAFAVIEGLFPDDLKGSILISDRLAAQLKLEVAGRQVCLAHLLRNLKDAIQIQSSPQADQWLVDFKHPICFDAHREDIRWVISDAYFLLDSLISQVMIH